MRAAGKKITPVCFKHSYTILNLQRTKICHFNFSLQSKKRQVKVKMCKDKMQADKPVKTFCCGKSTAIKAAKL